MVILGPMAYSVFTTITIAFLLDRSEVFGLETSSKSTSSPWFPSGPPPTKPPPEISEELQKVLPLVTFDCKGKKGYFSDYKFECEVFHYCKPDGTRNTFLCPPHSIFNQLSMVCEEISPFNTRLCQAGTATNQNSKKKLRKDTKAPIKKKHKEDSHQQHRMMPSLSKTDKTLATAGGFNAGIEDLLRYMDSKRHVKTVFDPNGFSGDLVRIQSSTVNPIAETITSKYLPKKSSEGSEAKFSKILSNDKKVVGTKDLMQTGESKVVEDIIVDKVEERKLRKHKRVGKVLDVDDVPKLQAKKHSHVSPRSATENPPISSINTTALSTSPSLFSADRSRAKEFRKSRRRNLNRRRKMMRLNETSESPFETAINITTVQNLQTARQDSSESGSQEDTSGKSSNIHYGRYSESWFGRTKSEIVQPYSLPPLPIPKGLVETTTKQAEGTTITSTTKKTGYRNKESRYRTTTVPTDTDESAYEKFGGKISELDHHHYLTNVKKDVTDEYKTPSETEDNLKNARVNAKKIFQNKSDGSQPNKEERFFNRFTKSPESLFPPPRAEPRELNPSEDEQHSGNTSEEEKSLDSFIESKTITTEDPIKGTHTYIGKHRTRVRDNFETRLKWRLNEDKRKKKIEVGSSFSDHTPPPSEISLQVPSTSESPFESTEPSTSAHEHLLNLMNEFLAMTYPDSEGQETEVVNDKKEMNYHHYKGKDSDMSHGESITEEVEELPPELLDVVDLIASQSDEDPQEIQTNDGHEIIKIKGPITHRHLKDILTSDDDFTSIRYRKKKKNVPTKKFHVSPSKNIENAKELEKVSQFSSLKLEPFLKQVGSFRNVATTIPKKAGSYMLRGQPTVLKAKKIPVRVIYRDQPSEINSYKQPRKSNVKIIRSQLPKPGFQVIQDGRIANTRPYSQPQPKRVPQNTLRPLVLHPKSIFPPHPPPLPKPALPFKFGFPFANGNRPLINEMAFLHRRRRSTLNRSKRHLPPNSHLLQFQRSMFPTFNPKFVPTFSPFKNMFAQLHSADSNVSPFNVQRYAAPPPNSPPAPVRHITQSGDQTVIVEEIPVPIHVEVPDPNFLRPVHTGNHKSNAINIFHNNHVPRHPSPPAIQTLPLLRGFQGRFPANNNYRPYGLPSSVRPPVMNYHSPFQYSQPLPPAHSLTNHGHIFALGITTKPLSSAKQQSMRSVISATGNQPSSYHAQGNTYSAYPYSAYQSAFTTPLSNEPNGGRLMFSGYKPPKLTQRPRLPSNVNNEGRTENRSPPSRPRQVQKYFYTTKRPNLEYTTQYKTPKSRPRTPLFSYDTNDSTLLNSKPSSSNGNRYPSSYETPTTRKKRPVRRRRPKPQTTTTQSSFIPKELSLTQPPPEQIPPPPSALPLLQEPPNSIHNNKVVSEASETSNYPPAGYYGKDQLVQFFDSSSNSFQKASTAKPYENNLGENPSYEKDESANNLSSENSDQLAFGTRLKSNSPNEKRKRKRQPVSSPTEKSEVQTTPNKNREQKFNRNLNSGSTSSPGSNYPRRGGESPDKPPRYRPRGRSSTTPSRQPGGPNPFAHSGNFYNVPSGIQGFVDPSYRPSHGHHRDHTDMFGIPHPVIEEKKIYLGPHGHRKVVESFFKVPDEVQQQQRSPLYKMNIKPMPESAREFFSEAIKESSKYKAEDGSEKDVGEKDKPAPDVTQFKIVDEQVVAKKLRKPKRKHRYHPRHQGEKPSSDSTGKPEAHQKQNSTGNKENTPTTTTTPTQTTTLDLRPFYTPTEKLKSSNDIKDQSMVLKPRAPLLPKVLPDLSKHLQNGKIDFKKLNATISTSVSVSGGFPQQQNNTNSGEESSNKRVFSSQNGGLAVVKSNNAKRKKQKQKSDRFGTSSGETSDADKSKYDIAASVLDIIKATTESDKQGGFYSNRYDTENSAASQISSAWLKDPSRLSAANNRTENKEN